MNDDKHIPEDATNREPLDPLEVLGAKPPANHQRNSEPQERRPQGSFEIAWRLGH